MSEDIREALRLLCSEDESAAEHLRVAKLALDEAQARYRAARIYRDRVARALNTAEAIYAGVKQEVTT